MAGYPNSPLNVANRLVAELDQGLISAQELNRRLDLFGQNLENWHGQLEGIRTSDAYQEGRDLVEDAKESLQAVYDGIDLLRDYAASRSPDTLQEARDLLTDASNFIADLIAVTEENMEELESDRGNPSGGDIVG